MVIMAYKDPEKRKEYARAYAKEWNRCNPEKHAANSEAWKKRNPERAKAAMARRNERYRLRRQGWTPEQVEEAFQLQDGRCWVCRVPLEREGQGPTSLCADHNHDTKTRRGLLCRRCNFAEGLIGGIGLKPAEWAERLQRYLDTFDEPLKE